MPKPAVTAENFWSRVQKNGPDECWPWIGCVSRSKPERPPYGRIDAFGFKGVYVHRVAYWLANGGELNLRKDSDCLVRHSCDNSICCNPAHLVVGTHLDNMRDKVERGNSRWWNSTTESPRAKLTDHDVRMIRIQFNPESGATRKALALLYDVSISTIKGVTSGRHYSDIA